MRKFLKIVAYILCGILLVVLGAIIWLQTPSGKRFVRDKALAFLRGKLKTEVYIGSIDYSLPKMIELNDVLFKDQAKDTLLAAHKLRVDLSMLKLIRGKVEVNRLDLDGLHAHVYRNAPDTNFNFTYILKAFTGTPKEPTPKEAEKANDTSSSLSFDVRKIKLSDIHVRFDDHTGGSLLSVNLDKLDLSLRKIDPSKLDFAIKKLAVSGLAANFTQDTSYLPKKVDTTPAPVFHIAADEITINKTSFVYNDHPGKFLMDIGVGALQLQPDKVDIAGQFIDLQKLTLSESSVKIWTGKKNGPPAAKDTVVAKADTAPNKWRVLLASGTLSQVNFKMDDENSPKQKSGMDYAHLDVQNLALDAESILYSPDTISGNIKHLAAKEQSGLDLRELRTKFAYHNKGGFLRDLYLQTDQTILQNYLEVGYPSLAALKTNMQAMQLKINLQKSIVGMKDVLLFAPTLAQQDFFRQNRNGHLRLEAIALGTVGNLDLRKLYLSGVGRTEVLLNGRLTGLPDANRLAYDLNIQKLQSGQNDLAPFLPAGVQQQLRLPDAFGITGKVAGNIKDYRMQLMLMSTDGNAYINGYVYMSPGKNKERYDLYLRTDRLNLGRILKQEDNMGPVTAYFTVKGRSFDVNNMTASLSGAIQSATLKQYTYTGITLKGNVSGKKGNLDLLSRDRNARLSLVANADFRPKYPAITADVNIDSINFQALKLYEKEFRMRGRIHADVPVMNPDYPQATIIIDRPTLTMEGQRYFLDSMYITSAPTPDSGQHIVIHTDVLQAQVTGHMPLTRTGDVIREHINRHYAAMQQAGVAQTKATAGKPVPRNYDLDLTATVLDRPLLRAFAPGISHLDTVKISAHTDPRSLNLDVTMAKLVYGENTIAGVAARVQETDSALSYRVAVDKFSQSKIELVNTTVQGQVNNNEITANLNIKDEKEKDRFMLSALLQQQGQDQVIQLGDRLMLNYKNWNVSSPNKIVFAKQGFYVENFNISSGNESIAVNSESRQYNAPLTMEIKNFLLSDVTEMVSKGDTLLANGIIDGTVKLAQLQSAPMFTADVHIQDFSALNDTVGNITAIANNAHGNAINANVAIDGHGNDVKLTGDYYIKPVNGNQFNMDLALNALSIQSVEGLAMRQIRNSSGYLRGKLHIAGTADKPSVKGDLHTDQLVTTVSMLNADYHMPAEHIAFTEGGVRFDQFKILDSAGNNVVINGDLLTKDFRNMAFDMSIRARKWRVLHSSSKDNKLFYGDVYLTTHLNIRGTPAAPDIDGNISILKGTAFTVVIPEKNPEVESSTGIVEFVDMRDTNRNKLLPPKTDTLRRLALSPGADINVNIAIEPEAEFNVIIDASSGDFIKVRGEAALNAAVSPGGTIGVTGTYELKEGAYQLNYNFIRRKFNIQPGSTIVFAGDPLQADVNITAIYIAEAAPYELVEKQVADEAQLNYYRQRVPFDVQLKMSGPLLQPLLAFDIVLPENKTYRLPADGVELVRSRLSQLRTDPSELNKQVFALLLLTRFIGEDPFASDVGGGFAFTAKQSVSRFIGEQLNRFASSLIKGVDLNVDLASNEDYTTGERRERTDLSVAASKRLLDDRLTLTVGNDFELDGPRTNSGDQNATLIPGNLAADYKLSPDGRYMVRAYRQNKDAGVLEGFVTETGVNFIITLDYNRFRDIFISRKKRQRMRMERQKERQADSTQRANSGS